MSKPPRPEPGTEYCGFPTAEFAEARSLSAVAGLAKFLSVTETRAAELLGDPDAYRAEIRARQPSPETQLRRRWRPGYADPYLP